MQVSLPGWQLKWAADDIRAMRMCLGLTLAMALALGINWPLAFLVPVLSLTLLNNRNPCLDFKSVVKLLAMVIMSGLVGLSVSMLLMDYPIVVMLVILVLLMNIFYLNTAGVSEFLVTMMLLSVTVIPIIGQQSNILAIGFSLGFLAALVIALLINWFMHGLFPDNPEDVIAKPVVKNKPDMNEYERLVTAVSSTLVVLPIILLFFSFELTNAALIMVFVVILAQNPDLQAGFKGCMAMIVGNSIGGIIAMIYYTVFSYAPTYTFMVLLMLLTAMLMAPKIFSENKDAALWGMALSTVVLLLGTTIMSDDADAGSKFYSRIAQIFIVTLYVVGTFSLIQWLRDWYDMNRLNKPEVN